MFQDISPYNMVLSARLRLGITLGKCPSIKELALHIGTQERILKMFFMRYKDNMSLKDIGSRFEICADRVTQLLYKFSHDLLLFYCRENNRKEY